MTDEPEPILAAQFWPTNASLIADVAALYLDHKVRTLDPTYGRGSWWKEWRPRKLVKHDLHTLDGVDFRHLPHRAHSFGQIAFDPPYVSVGGRKTSGLPDYQNRYGMDTSALSPKGVQSLVDEGLAEMVRLLKPEGILLVKVQDYVSSGKLQHGTFQTQCTAVALGLKVIDRFEHLSKSPRPQPPGREQKHGRRNLSTLFVMEGPK